MSVLLSFIHANPAQPALSHTAAASKITAAKHSAILFATPTHTHAHTNTAALMQLKINNMPNAMTQLVTMTAHTEQLKG